jgi:hypothetical protein
MQGVSNSVRTVLATEPRPFRAGCLRWRQVEKRLDSQSPLADELFALAGGDYHRVAK